MATCYMDSASSTCQHCTFHHTILHFGKYIWRATIMIKRGRSGLGGYAFFPVIRICFTYNTLFQNSDEVLVPF